MKVFLFTILLFLFSARLHAQKQTVIIIDTLEGSYKQLIRVRGQKPFRRITWRERVVSIYEQKLDEDIFSNIAEQIQHRKHPNVVATVTESKGLRLILDQKGGFISWNIPEHETPDTIRINKWTIYQNSNTDTFRYSFGYWRCYNDSCVYDASLEKNKVVVTKHKGLRELPQINITINGRLYTLAVEKVKSEPMFSGHGYKPRKRHEKYLAAKYSGKPIKKTYRFKKFHYSSWHTKLIFEGSIDSLHQ